MDLNLYKDFSILCVDDDENILFTYKLLFEMFFKKVYTARDGKEGLEVFKSNSVDIIITDYAMPNLDGIEMTRKIRGIDFNVPILLVTAFENQEILKKALDVNITAFIKKPIDKKQLFSKFELIAKSILAERYLLNKQTKIIKYNLFQEKMAYQKEKLISKSYQEKIDKFNIEVFYKPKDILAGDSFVIKENIIFLVDAMGKGVSASITAMLSSAFVNYCINFHNFEEIIKKYIEFIKEYLLEEEIVSASFLTIQNNLLKYATFSMPAILISDGNGYKKIKSNNPPISKRTNKFKIDEIEIDFKKAMIYTDGVNEAEIGDKLYYQELKKDFEKSEGLKKFLSIFLKKVTINDDTTIVFLSEGK